MSRRARLVEPVTVAPDADLDLPGSKSLVNRALVAAALAEGTSVIRRLLLADDTFAMIEGLRALGVTIELDTAHATARVVGRAGGPVAGPVTIDARQSGTTARFLLPLLAAGEGTYRLDGHDQLRRRPQGPLLDALRALGAQVVERGDEGALPVEVTGGLRGGRVALPGDVSSQFVSGLLLIAPVLDAPLEIELTTEPVSLPYLTMTVGVMQRFGASVTMAAGRRFRVEPTGYRAIDLVVEPDASTASYFLAAAAITGGRVRVNGLGRSSLQGDVGFAELLGRMGATVDIGPDAVEVRGGPLRGISADMVELSDTAPTMAAVAPFATGPTTVRGVGFIRGKESDRISAVVTELRRCGIEATDDGDGFTIVPGSPRPATIETYEDHRIAMAFAVLGLRAGGITIADPDCVAKTFPRFWETLEELRVSGEPAPRVVALDGPAGSGKSTVARRLAERLGLDYLDTGAMYRAVAFAVLEAGVDPADAGAVAAVAQDVDIVVADRVLVDGADATTAIRGPEVTRLVSPVAANPGVRSVLRERQRAWARHRGGGVLEGRDIGTVVFPDAVLKVYLTADPHERARRRAAETGEDPAEVLASIERRDRIDSTRAESPLAEASDAVVVDTTGLTVDEVLDRIVAALARAEEAQEGDADGEHA